MRVWHGTLLPNRHIAHEFDVRARAARTRNCRRFRAAPTIGQVAAAACLRSDGYAESSALRRMQAWPQRLANVAIVCLSSPVRCRCGSKLNGQSSARLGIGTDRLGLFDGATANQFVCPIGTQACKAVWWQDQSRRRRRRRLRTLRRLCRRHRCLGSRW